MLVVIWNVYTYFKHLSCINAILRNIKDFGLMMGARGTIPSFYLETRITLGQGSSTRGPGRVFHKIQCIMNI